MSRHDDGSGSEGDGQGRRRTRKRRTRSYDPVKMPSGENGNGKDESESDAWTSPDRGGAPSFSDFARRGGVPTTLFGAPSVYDSKLMAVMGLLAYTDPASSPLGYLVSGLQNQAIADKVNDAVLAADTSTHRNNGPHSTQYPNPPTPVGSGGSSAAAHAVAPTSGLEFAVRHLLAIKQAKRETAGDGYTSAGRTRVFF